MALIAERLQSFWRCKMRGDELDKVVTSSASFDLHFFGAQAPFLASFESLQEFMLACGPLLDVRFLLLLLGSEEATSPRQ